MAEGASDSEIDLKLRRRDGAHAPSTMLRMVSFPRFAGAEVLCAALLLGAFLALAACSHQDSSVDPELNAYPAHYKADILAAMHAYLNDPTGIRDAAIADPALKDTGDVTRYVVCLKFNAKKNNSAYAGVREIVAVFLVGRFDHFIETPKDLCTGATYLPFPELQNLQP